MATVALRSVRSALRTVSEMSKLAERQSCDMALRSSRANIQRAVVHSRTVHGCYPRISPPQLGQSPLRGWKLTEVHWPDLSWHRDILIKLIILACAVTIARGGKSPESHQPDPEG
jgi:hypothetical protein